jgi:Spy/CpxP family protein refolding chaperone
MTSPKFLLCLAGAALLATSALRADDGAAPPPPPPDQPAHHGRREDMLARFNQMVKDLDLTADQQTKVQAILKQSAESIKALRDDTALSREDRRSKLMALRKSTEQQIHALLTPEQQAKAKELRAKHRPNGDQPPADMPPPDKPSGI